MASEVQKEIQRIVNEFSDQILQVVKRAVFASLDGNDGKLASPAVVARRTRTPSAKGPKAAKGAKAKAAAPARAKPGPKPGGRKSRKSTPEEVEKLGGEIIAALQSSGELMSASELMKALKVPTGQFHYALGKLKADNKVTQHGERRMARYGAAGGKGKGKGKAPKAKAAEGEEAAEG